MTSLVIKKFLIQIRIKRHCVKSVRIRSFLNAQTYGPEKLRIQALFTECEFVLERRLIKTLSKIEDGAF